MQPVAPGIRSGATTRRPVALPAAPSAARAAAKSQLSTSTRPTAQMSMCTAPGGWDGCPESGAELLENLASYCALDTMAMVHIVHELRELVYGGP